MGGCHWTRLQGAGRHEVAVLSVAKDSAQPNTTTPPSARGGEAAAIVLSFIESAKLHNLNPYEYLRDVLIRLPSAKASDLDALLPDTWQPR